MIVPWPWPRRFAEAGAWEETIRREAGRFAAFFAPRGLIEALRGAALPDADGSRLCSVSAAGLPSGGFHS